METTPERAAAFERYTEMLLSEGRRFNLTALRDRESIQRRHFGESLALLRALEQASAFASPAIDIGSGAGFPGLPIKIARPEIALTLLEATGKKARFLEEVVAALGLNRVQVVHGRAEDIAHDSQRREAYALALARAVAPLRILVELALPFVRVGGHLAAPKGSGAAREVREAVEALRICGGEVALVQELDATGPGARPTLVLVRKVTATPPQYPRRLGVPAHRPL